MINPEKIWSLIAMKMAGEQLTADLRELEEWLKNEPELEENLILIVYNWQPGRYNKKQVQQAFRKVANRMADINNKIRVTDRQTRSPHRGWLKQVRLKMTAMQAR